MFWFKIQALVSINMTENVPTSVFVTTKSTGNFPKVSLKISSGFMLINVRNTILSGGQ